MLKGYRKKSRNMFDLFLVPSTYWFSKIINWNEIVNWIMLAVTTLISLLFGIGFVIDPSVPDIAGYIIFAANAVASLPAVAMMLFGNRVTISEFRIIRDAEERYNQMSRKDRKRYRKHLKSVYKHPEKLATTAKRLFTEHYENRPVENGDDMLQIMNEELKARADAKRIYEDSLSKASGGYIEGKRVRN